MTDNVTSEQCPVSLVTALHARFIVTITVVSSKSDLRIITGHVSHHVFSQQSY